MRVIKGFCIEDALSTIKILDERTPPITEEEEKGNSSDLGPIVEWQFYSEGTS